MTPAFFSSVINSYLPEPHAALLNGIIFGIPLRASKMFYHELQVVGLLHLVVLSGINITILGYIVGVFTHRLPKKLNILITIGCIGGFTLFVGPQPPIIRAAIMGSLGYLAVLYGRKNTALISLLISVIIIALFKPDWIAGISFQLSVGATLGIILFNKKNTDHPSTPPLQEIIISIKNDLQTSFSAQIFTAPLIFIYFKQISFISPLANLLVAPLVAPLMIFGFLTSVLGKIHYVLGLPSAYVCYGLLTYIIWIVDFLSKLPFVFIDFNR